tara:strand:- start:240 stop:413 length:174 start_codon:yes stop_codon:yes gene_type:complete
MNKWKRLFWVLFLIAVSISNIGLMPEEFYALLAMLNLLIGVIIGMTIFLPCGNTDKG